jgi:hypothetical protein
MGIEAIKRDFKDFIESNISQLDGKVTSTYPDVMRFNSPTVVIDIIASRSSRTLISGANKRTKAERLVKIIIISSNTLEIDELSDLFESNFSGKPEEFTSCYPFGVQSISPVMLAFEEKEDVYRRDFDVIVKEII